MSKKIVIDLKIDGTSKIEAFGYEGNTCEQATQVFEDMLGNTEAKDYKNEYYNQATNTNENNNKNNINQY